MNFLRVNNRLNRFRKFHLRKFSSESQSAKSPCNELTKRGMVKEYFPFKEQIKINEVLSSNPQCIYAGFDPTADSLHVGNLLVILGLIHFQRSGHHPIALVGGATGRIGDPSGKSDERPVLKMDEIQHNVNCIQNQIQRIFDNHEKLFWNKKERGKLQSLKVVNNIDWYKDFNILDFIGSVGRHFRIGDMLSLTSVKTRLKSPEGISFTEFSYQIFQSFDWLQLFKQFRCRFQLGGSDQLGNLQSGYHLIKRVEQKPVYGLTMPILLTRGGKKFGKSEGNAVWLDAEKTSPFSFYQFFLRLEDDEIEERLKVFSLFELEEIDEMMKAFGLEERHNRVPQRRLAEQMTLLIHGEEGLKKAKQVTAALYNGDFSALSTLSREEIQSVFEGAHVCSMFFKPGMTILELALETKCFKHEREATRLITEGGFYVNLNRCKNINEIISPSVHIMKNNVTLLRVGKRNYFIIDWKN